MKGDGLAKGASSLDTGGATLSRESIIPAALALMDAEGVEGLSMRKLAASLGVSAQAMYWHFSNKDDLCRAVVDFVRESFRFDEQPTLPVVDQLRAHMWALREHWSQHPSIMALGLRFFPAEAGRITQFGTGLLVALGFSRDEALLHYRAAVWTVLGFSYVEHGAANSVHHTLVDPVRRVYEVRLANPAEAGGGGSAEVTILNVDELFDIVVDLFVRGLMAKKRSRRRS